MKIIDGEIPVIELTRAEAEEAAAEAIVAWGEDLDYDLAYGGRAGTCEMPNPILAEAYIMDHKETALNHLTHQYGITLPESFDVRIVESDAVPRVACYELSCNAMYVLPFLIEHRVYLEAWALAHPEIQEVVNSLDRWKEAMSK